MARRLSAHPSSPLLLIHDPVCACNFPWRTSLAGGFCNSPCSLTDSSWNARCPDASKPRRSVDDHSLLLIDSAVASDALAIGATFDRAVGGLLLQWANAVISLPQNVR
jgi:hypothetical protein